MDWNLTSIEEQLLREEKTKPETNPNIDYLPSKRLSYGRIFLFIALGILIFRLILEIIGLLLK